jgi:hypothetical protein
MDAMGLGSSDRYRIRIATLWGGALALAILLPRSLAFVGPLLVLLTAVGLHFAAPTGGGAYFGASSAGAGSGRNRVAFLLLLGFAGWALLSASWSLDAISALQKSALLAGLIGVLWWLQHKLSVVDEKLLAAISTAVVIATAVTAVAIAIETLTNQALSRAIMTHLPFMQPRDPKHVSIVDGVIIGRSEAELNRRTAALVLFLWPAVMGFWALWARRDQLIKGGSSARSRQFGLTGFAAVAAVGLSVLTGNHQSSMLALAVSLTVFALASVRPRVAVALSVVGWLGIMLLIVPIALCAYSNGWQHSSWLQHSARHRIVIWHETAQHVIGSPWLGIGAEATPVLHKAIGAGTLQIEKDTGFEKTVARHAHNAYLQVWLELGVPGALLMLAAGLAVLAVIAQFPASTLPFALAHWSAIVAMMATSYGLWQLWILGAIMGSIGAMMIAIRLRRLDETVRTGL